MFVCWAILDELHIYILSKWLHFKIQFSEPESKTQDDSADRPCANCQPLLVRYSYKHLYVKLLQCECMYINVLYTEKSMFNDKKCAWRTHTCRCWGN